MKIKYRKLTRKERKGHKYKYELTRTYVHKVDLGSRAITVAGYLFYDPKKKQLWIFKKYWWDGSSVVFDTKACMRASLVHDALYQLMRLGLLDYKWRDYADRLYRDMCIEDGMWGWHAGLRYLGLKWFAGKHAKRIKK